MGVGIEVRASIPGGFVGMLLGHWLKMEEWPKNSIEGRNCLEAISVWDWTSTFGGLVGPGTLGYVIWMFWTTSRGWVPRGLALDLRVHTLSCFVQVVVFNWEVSMETADSRFTGS